MPNLKQEHINIHNFIDRIEFTPIITGITYKDGSGSFAVCSEEDTYDPEKGFAFALLNRIFGHNLWKDYVRKFIPSMPQHSLKDEVDTLVQQNDTLQAASVYTSDKVKYLDMTVDSLKRDNNNLKYIVNNALKSYQELYDNYEELMERYKEEYLSSILNQTTDEEEKVEEPQETTNETPLERIINTLLDHLEKDDIIY